MPNWTVEQESAIASRGQALLVAAAAGSGKTAVLIERVYRLLEEGASLDRMLIVTFTRAAASELRMRLTDRLEKAKDEAWARGHLIALEEARIGTIHSFCSQLIRESFAWLDVDPAFRVGDAAEMEILRAQAADDALDELLLEETEGMRALMCAYDDIARLREDVLAVHRFSMSHPAPDEWLALAGEHDRPDAPWRSAFCASVRDRLDATVALLLRAVDACGEDARASAILSGDIAEAERLRAALKGGPETFADALNALAFARWTAKNPDAKALRDEAIAPVKELEKKLAGGDHLRWLAGATHVARALASLAKRTQEVYALLKDRRDVLDYDDLEHTALRLLTQNTAVSARLRDRLEHVFIDECQDISRVQDALLRAASHPERRFYVGDVKQSIYRFRQAAPELFLAKQRAFSREAEARARRIDLAHNFRSRPAVLTAVNAVFERLMTGAVGEIDYSDGHGLAPGLSFPDDGPQAALHLICRDGQEEPAEERQSEEGAEEAATEEELETAAIEARAVARRALGLIGSPIFDAKTGLDRPARPGDIAVLLRAPRSVADAFEREFTLAGVPLYSDVARSSGEEGEVLLALALFRAVDNPRRDTDLIAAMLSPAGGFSPDEMMEIRAESGEGTYFDAVTSMSFVASSLGQKTRAFLDKLTHLRRRALSLPAGEAAHELLLQSGLYDACLAFENGPARQRNLRALCENAASLCAAPRKTLGDFLLHVERLRAGGGDLESARAMDDTDVVRLMSVHQSKGLEFPIVLVAGLGRKFNLRDIGRLPMHRGIGMGADFIDPDALTRQKTLKQYAISQKLRDESLCEEMRILYVAMTRAKERLELFGCVTARKADQLEGSSLSPGWMSGALTFLDMLVPAVNQARQSPGCAWSVLRELPAGTAKSADTAAPSAREEDHAWLDERLNWVYPHVEVKMPSKQSVTSLAHRDLPELRELPAEARSSGAHTAAELGVAAHRLLSFMRILPPDAGEEAIKEAAAKARAALTESREFPRGPEGDRLEAAVRRFWATPLGLEARAADRVMREAPFELELSAREIDPDVDSGDRVLLQGVVDLCFIRKGQWVLVDFKTDRVAPRDAVDAAQNRHARQVALYALALERITETPVAAAYIVFLSADTIVNMNNWRQNT